LLYRTQVYGKWEIPVSIVLNHRTGCFEWFYGNWKSENNELPADTGFVPVTGYLAGLPGTAGKIFDKSLQNSNFFDFL
jgi:hypothetical protein